MNTFDDFPWNGNELVKMAYDRDNYKILYNKTKNKQAIIFFSSNGIYYPNNEEIFRKRILDNDYYDWQNISKNKLISNNFEKVIFVRDLYKQWYVTGINSEINSIDKLLEFLKSELNGYEITTCGSSAGGYAAVLFGSLLKAKKTICNSAIFDLDLVNNPGPFVEQYKTDELKHKYYNLLEFVKDSADNIYYFYPGKTDYDQLQSSVIKETCIHKIMIDSDEHGTSLRGKCYPYVIAMDKEKLDRICNKYRGKLASKDEVYKSVVPFYKALVIMPIYKAMNLMKMTKHK